MFNLFAVGPQYWYLMNRDASNWMDDMRNIRYLKSGIIKRIYCSSQAQRLWSQFWTLHCGVLITLYFNKSWDLTLHISVWSKVLGIGHVATVPWTDTKNGDHTGIIWYPQSRHGYRWNNNKKCSLQECWFDRFSCCLKSVS